MLVHHKGQKEFFINLPLLKERELLLVKGLPESVKWAELTLGAVENKSLEKYFLEDGGNVTEPVDGVELVYVRNPLQEGNYVKAVAVTLSWDRIPLETYRVEFTEDYTEYNKAPGKEVTRFVSGLV